jgi:hypothetical protein
VGEVPQVQDVRREGVRLRLHALQVTIYTALPESSSTHKPIIYFHARAPKTKLRRGWFLFHPSVLQVRAELLLPCGFVTIGAHVYRQFESMASDLRMDEPSPTLL